MTEFSAAVIGCGMFGGLYEAFDTPTIYSHAKAYTKSPLFGRLAFVDPDAKRAGAVAEKAGGETFTDAASMMASFAPDTVSIVTPDDTHLALARDVMTSPTRPKLVFMEKPVCRSLDELEELEALERETGVRVIVNHSRRFDTAYAELRRRVRNGDFGELVRVHADVYGGWRHLAVHVVDLLHYFFDDRLEISAAEYAAPSRYADDPTLDIEAALGGAPVRFVGFDEANYQLLEATLYFTGGLIRLPDFGTRIEIFTTQINAERERVPVLDQTASGPAMTDAMPRAIASIGAYLKQPGGDALDLWGLAEARRTMTVVWEGMKLYAAQSD